ncbi:hypothetical protein R1sor_022367 [Riccia sorocarpa]|uniref:Uncharacterized protein n=1 Tax=Riccia sorocarpa TaxID=122646 RepID=A0ABD3GLD6_9MARC
MACFSRKRKGKRKLSDLPEEAEEGELMAPIPFASPPKQFGKKSGASASIGVRNERVVENAKMRHSWFAWKLCIDPDQFGFDTPSVEVEECLRNVVCGVLGKFADNYDMWLKSPQFERWTKAFRKRAGMWDEWFRRQPELRNPGSLS